MNNTKNNLGNNKSLAQLFSVGLATVISILSASSAMAQKPQSNTHEIGWSSRLSSMGLNIVDNVGKTYNFYCQKAAKNTKHAPVWGTNVYTPNSGICSTAVHSGMISEDGGYVTVEITQGQEFYTGSSKNDVQSKDHATTILSYVFVGEPIIVNGQNLANQPPSHQPRSRGIEQVVVGTVQKGVERTIEEAIISIFK